MQVKKIFFFSVGTIPLAILFGCPGTEGNKPVEKSREIKPDGPGLQAAKEFNNEQFSELSPHAAVYQRLRQNADASTTGLPRLAKKPSIDLSERHKEKTTQYVRATASVNKNGNASILLIREDVTDNVYSVQSSITIEGDNPATVFVKENEFSLSPLDAWQLAVVLNKNRGILYWRSADDIAAASEAKKFVAFRIVGNPGAEGPNLWQMDSQ
ncbi:MAG: hypothetical protein U0570_08180 [Phycisphaerales bacterium]